jgi:hypothetical protein
VLEGRIVRLEPLRAEHEEALWEASRDPGIWRWKPILQPRTRADWNAHVRAALAAAYDGTEIPLVTLRDARVVNERARRAIEALGATFEGIHRKHLLVRGGENRDTAWYSVTDDDWPEVEARLAEKLP